MLNHDLAVLMVGVMTNILAIAILAPLFNQLLLENLKHRVLRYQYSEHEHLRTNPIAIFRKTAP